MISGNYMIIPYILLSLCGLGLLYCFGALIQLARCSVYYTSKIDLPWGDAIKRLDHEACERYHMMAKQHLADMNSIIGNPLKWFRPL